jgi:hypothetical protein
MAPKRKDPDAAFPARPPRMETSPPAGVSASHAPGEPLAPTRRSVRSTRSTANYCYDCAIRCRGLDIDHFMAVNDSDEAYFTTSDDEQSLSSATPSVLDMSSDQCLAHPTRMLNSHLTSEQRPPIDALAQLPSQPLSTLLLLTQHKTSMPNRRSQNRRPT